MQRLVLAALIFAALQRESSQYGDGGVWNYPTDGSPRSTAPGRDAVRFASPTDLYNSAGEAGAAGLRPTTGTTGYGSVPMFGNNGYGNPQMMPAYGSPTMPGYGAGLQQMPVNASPTMPGYVDYQMPLNWFPSAPGYGNFQITENPIRNTPDYVSYQMPDYRIPTAPGYGAFQMPAGNRIPTTPGYGYGENLMPWNGGAATSSRDGDGAGSLMATENYESGESFRAGSSSENEKIDATTPDDRAESLTIQQKRRPARLRTSSSPDNENDIPNTPVRAESLKSKKLTRRPTRRQTISSPEISTAVTSDHGVKLMPQERNRRKTTPLRRENSMQPDVESAKQPIRRHLSTPENKNDDTKPILKQSSSSSDFKRAASKPIQKHSSPSSSDTNAATEPILNRTSSSSDVKRHATRPVRRHRSSPLDEKSPSAKTISNRRSSSLQDKETAAKRPMSRSLSSLPDKKSTTDPVPKRTLSSSPDSSEAKQVLSPSLPSMSENNDATNPNLNPDLSSLPDNKSVTKPVLNPSLSLSLSDNNTANFIPDQRLSSSSSPDIGSAKPDRASPLPVNDQISTPNKGADVQKPIIQSSSGWNTNSLQSFLQKLRSNAEPVSDNSSKSGANVLTSNSVDNDDPNGVTYKGRFTKPTQVMFRSATV